MKRNHIPVDSEEKEKDEDLISERLDHMFDDDQNSLRRTCNIHKGEWIPDREHVKLDSTAIPHSYAVMSHYSSEHKYHYLTRFSALFYFETYLLNLQYRGSPLSLAEAYILLLNRPNDLRDYRVYQLLLRQGYIGVPRAISFDTKEVHGAISKEVLSERSEPTEQPISRSPFDCNKPLIKISADVPINDILKQLRQYGPKYRSSEIDNNLDVILGEDYSAFDLYERKLYTMKRPDKNTTTSRTRKSDKTVIVIDINQIESIRTDIVRNDNSNSLIFALVDSHQEICYSRFKSIQLDELDRL